MPLYEYQCQECGEVHEIIQRVDDPPLTICSECGGALKKLISAPAIQFKGSGFYITDYGKGNGASAKSGESSSGESGAKSSDASGGSAAKSKPAASETKS